MIGARDDFVDEEAHARRQAVGATDAPGQRLGPESRFDAEKFIELGYEAVGLAHRFLVDEDAQLVGRKSLEIGRYLAMVEPAREIAR